MNEPVTIRVAGEPQAKNRHRSRIAVAKDGRRFIGTYADPTTAKYEFLIKQHGQLAMRGRELMRGPVRLRIFVFAPIPASWPQWKQEAAIAQAIRPTSGRDWDNYGKVVSDALNGIVWVDDAQVIHGTVDKFYSDSPALVIDIQKTSEPTTAAEWRAMQEERT